tara:strand:+ start:198 stop:524 length:327 start_codon:yes stop_codon:yes gene_type:complete
MLIQITKIKKLINSRQMSLSTLAVDSINRAVEDLIIQMCDRATEDGMKTVMAQHTGVISKSNQATEGIKCQRCCTIKNEFLKFAQSIQVWCHDEATILFNRLKKEYRS